MCLQVPNHILPALSLLLISLHTPSPQTTETFLFPNSLSPSLSSVLTECSLHLLHLSADSSSSFKSVWVQAPTLLWSLPWLSKPMSGKSVRRERNYTAGPWMPQQLRSAGSDSRMRKWALTTLREGVKTTSPSCQFCCRAPNETTVSLSLRFPLIPYNLLSSTSSQRNPCAHRHAHNSAPFLTGTPEPPRRDRRPPDPSPLFPALLGVPREKGPHHASRKRKTSTVC